MIEFRSVKSRMKIPEFCNLSLRNFVTCPFFFYYPNMSMRTPEILIIAALRQEVESLIHHTIDLKIKDTNLSPAVKRSLNRYWEPVEFSGRVGVLCCGVGGKRARKSLRHALEVISPQRILIPGFAGAINPIVNIGDLVICDTTFNLTLPDAPSCEFDKEQTSRFGTMLKNRSIQFFRGPAVCSDIMVDKKSMRDRILRKFNALCVDMESFHLLKLLQKANIPTSMIRVISDNANESLGLDFNKLPRGKWKTRFYFLMHPFIYFAYRRVVKTAMATTKQLNDATRVFIQTFLLTSINS